MRGSSVASISDVAKLAGVSEMSVSRVLNGSPRVSNATHQRVLEAVVACNYVPSAAARASRAGR